MQIKSTDNGVRWDLKPTKCHLYFPVAVEFQVHTVQRLTIIDHNHYSRLFSQHAVPLDGLAQHQQEK